MATLLRKLQAQNNCTYQSNNLCCLIDTKSLSSCQAYWAQELSKYYFQRDYYQKKNKRSCKRSILLSSAK